MPSTSRKQQQAMCMALAARHKHLPVSKLKGAALELYKSDMLNKQLKDFTVYQKECLMRSLYDVLTESLLRNAKGDIKSEFISAFNNLLKDNKFDTNTPGTDSSLNYIRVLDNIVDKITVDIIKILKKYSYKYKTQSYTNTTQINIDELNTIISISYPNIKHAEGTYLDIESIDSFLDNNFILELYNVEK